MNAPLPAHALRPATAARITNALTIDVEDYFQVSAFAPHIARAEWDQRECRVERNVHTILDMLDAHATQATFFTLGWIAERYPALVREIVARGHELASHGHGHQRASDLTSSLNSAGVRSLARWWPWPWLASSWPRATISRTSAG